MIWSACSVHTHLTYETSARGCETDHLPGWDPELTLLALPLRLSCSRHVRRVRLGGPGSRPPTTPPLLWPDRGWTILSDKSAKAPDYVRCRHYLKFQTWAWSLGYWAGSSTAAPELGRSGKTNQANQSFATGASVLTENWNSVRPVKVRLVGLNQSLETCSFLKSAQPPN